MRATGEMVLVVDDDPYIREMVAMVLEEGLGVRTVLAADGREALRLLADGNPPALVVTDVQMPNVDGAELVRQLRASPTARDVPVVVVAASPAWRDKAMRAGADDYLDKPFDVEALWGKIRKHLGMPSRKPNTPPRS